MYSSFVSTTIDGLVPNDKRAFGLQIYFNNADISLSQFIEHNYATQVRFVKYQSNHTIIYPNPTTSIVTLQGGKQYDSEVSFSQYVKSFGGPSRGATYNDKTVILF